MKRLATNQNKKAKKINEYEEDKEKGRDADGKDVETRT